MKRILSFAMVLVMMLGLMVPQTAFAKGENWYIEVTIKDLQTKHSVTQISDFYLSLSSPLSDTVAEMVREGYTPLQRAFAGTAYWDNIIQDGIDAYDAGLGGDYDAWDDFIDDRFVDDTYNWAYLDGRYYAENLVFQTVLGDQYSTLNSLRLANKNTDHPSVIKGYFRCPEKYGSVYWRTYEVVVSLKDANKESPINLIVIYEGSSVAKGETSEPLACVASNGNQGSVSKNSLTRPLVVAGTPISGEELGNWYFRSCINGYEVIFSLDESGNLVVTDYHDEQGGDQCVFPDYFVVELYDSNWNLLADMKQLQSGPVTIDNPTTIYAVVKNKDLKRYTLTYVVNGESYVVGTFAEGTEITLSNYDSLNILEEGIDRECTLSGFKDEDRNQVTTVTMTGNRTVYADIASEKTPELIKEEDKLYVLTYRDVLNGAVQPESYIYGDPCESGETVTLTNPDSQTALSSGYTFEGWYLDSSLQTPVPNNMITMPAADTEIYAKWTKSGGGGGGTSSSVTLTFDVGSGGQVQDQDSKALSRNQLSVSTGTTVNLLNYTGVKDGYNFLGWYSDAALTKPAVEVKMDSSKTVYAKWEKKSFVPVTAPIPALLNGEDHYAYIIGYADGGIHPGGSITRAEVATIFFRLLKDEVRDANYSKTSAFTDVKAGAWYNNAIATLEKLNILTGYEDGSFLPNKAITRAEFAAVIARFDAVVNTAKTDFTDITGHWAENAINQAANNGWVNGYADGTYGPGRSITRAETVTMVNRVLHRQPASTSDLLDAMKKWPDNSDISMWYYIPMQEATNSHTYTMRENGSEKWGELTADRDWLALER